MKKILNITLAAAFACAMTGCQDFLDTSSPSVVDRDFVFSNEESARGALYYGYETLRANRVCIMSDSSGIRFGDRILKTLRTFTMKVAPESVKNGIIRVVRATITLTREKEPKYLPSFTKRYPWPIPDIQF